MKRYEVIRWESPRPSKTGGVTRRDGDGGVWRDVADALRAHPGLWAVIKEHPNYNALSSAVAGIKFGTLVAFRPPLDFDATVRVEADRSLLYARYTPDGEA